MRSFLRTMYTYIGGISQFCQECGEQDALCLTIEDTSPSPILLSGSDHISDHTLHEQNSCQAFQVAGELPLPSSLSLCLLPCIESDHSHFSTVLFSQVHNVLH